MTSMKMESDRLSYMKASEGQGELMHEIRAITQRDAQAYSELSAELAATGRASSWSFSTRYRSMVVFENSPFVLLNRQGVRPGV